MRTFSSGKHGPHRSSPARWQVLSVQKGGVSAAALALWAQARVPCMPEKREERESVSPCPASLWFSLLSSLSVLWAPLLHAAQQYLRRSGDPTHLPFLGTLCSPSSGNCSALNRPQIQEASLPSLVRGTCSVPREASLYLARVYADSWRKAHLPLPMPTPRAPCST